MTPSRATTTQHVSGFDLMERTGMCLPLQKLVGSGIPSSDGNINISIQNESSTFWLSDTQLPISQHFKGNRHSEHHLPGFQGNRILNGLNRLA
jgi:hypothetical protein